MVDHEVREHANPDVDAADEACGQEWNQRPGQPVAAFGDHPVERLLDLRFPPRSSASGSSRSSNEALT
jgi:hypothetical protein